jgi:hypothetical protein
MTDYRIVLCEYCHSEGRIYTCDGGPDVTDWGSCPACEGTGGEVIEVFPIGIEDLETVVAEEDAGS